MEDWEESGSHGHTSFGTGLLLAPVDRDRIMGRPVICAAFGDLCGFRPRRTSADPYHGNPGAMDDAIGMNVAVGEVLV